MGNAILEIVDAFNEIIENNNGSTYSEAYYRGSRIGGAIGKIVRDTLGIEKL
jgi:hypothetical protein